MDKTRAERQRMMRREQMKKRKKAMETLRERRKWGCRDRCWWLLVGGTNRGADEGDGAFDEEGSGDGSVDA
jgi:hypothetical protein